MRVAGILVQEDAGPGHLAGLMVVVGNHVQQYLLVTRASGGRSAVNEKGLIYFLAVNGNGIVLIRIRREATAVFVFIFVLGGLVVIPDAAIAIVCAQRCAPDRFRRDERQS